jgi:flavodoxin I
MNKVGIFYGPQGGSTEKVAKQIAEQFGELAVLKLVSESRAEDVNSFDNVIFGVATLGRETWNSTTNSDWDVFFSELDKIDVVGKTFAIFGLGDHIAYANQFVDAMGKVGAKLLERDAKIVGKCATCEYTFNESEAVIGDQFIGLPLDEIFEKEKTDERVKDWTVRLKNRFA